MIISLSISFFNIKKFYLHIILKKDVIFLGSYWLEWAKNHKFESKIDGDYVADVVIVGAGIFGLTARILFG